MSGAFDDQFAGDARARIPGQPDPGVIAACADQPAEAAVIGALLRDEKLIDRAADRLQPEDFSDHLLGEVFAVITSSWGQGTAPRPIPVAHRFLNNEEMVGRGGAKYLAQLAASDRAGIGIEYVDHLADLARRRLLARALTEVRPTIGDTSVGLEEIASTIETGLSQTLLRSSATPAIGIAQAWRDAIKHIEAVAAGTQETGLKIGGLPEWNDIVGGGLFPGQLILLGGRPGMGKTALALAIARLAAKTGAGVLFISREMPVDQLMKRIVADMLFEAGSSATLDDVIKGKLHGNDFRRCAEIEAMLESWSLMFEQPAALNGAQVGMLVRRHQREMAQRGAKLGLVVVDYLGLLDPVKSRGNREQEMSDISREMKGIARSSGVPMLALAQLNRAVEQREDKRPMLSDLRDSGSLEQDADTVVFAYRAEYYLRQTEPDANDTKRRDAWQLEMDVERDRLEIYSAKVRQGEPQRRKIYFFGKHQAVRDTQHFRFGGTRPA